MKDEIMKDREEERRDAVDDERTRVAADMLKRNCSLSLIEDISKLSEDTIRTIAENIGVAISLSLCGYTRKSSRSP